MKYELEWQYSDEMEQDSNSEEYIHFVFMLRFPDVPLGKGHVAHFCFNVMRSPHIGEPGISVVRRGFLASIPLSKPAIVDFVELAVSQAFEKGSRDEAIDHLNDAFIYDDADFADEFVADLVEEDELLAMIERAFDGVERDDGITLHQAVVIDDYGSQEEFDAAAKLDTETRWQDVSDEDIASNPSIYCFLDPKGFRYYLPASMTWAVKNFEKDDDDSGFFTYLAVLPTVAPRNVGRGIGNAFDLDSFIKEHSFTHLQVRAIYSFICFMAIKAECGMGEDYYAATQKWQKAAQYYNSSSLDDTDVGADQ